MKIINYGHSCFKIIEDDLSIVFDPYEDNSVPGLKIDKIIKANYLFISHSHQDHNAVNKVEIINIDKPLKYKRIEIPHDKNNGALRGMNLATIIYFSNMTICHLGDIGDITSLENCSDFDDLDIVLCPINGYYTIGALEAIEIMKKKNWKIIIPMHYQKPNSGYPDGGQINIFKNNIEYEECDNNYIDIDKIDDHKKSIIFK